MQLSYSLTLPTDLRYVSVVRHLCIDTLGELGVTEDCVDDIALAVTEACANVVQHVGGDQDFEVRIAVDHETCRIEVVDTGRRVGAPPTQKALAILSEDDDVATHGRGLGLMRVLVDRMHFTPGVGGSTVVLIKDLTLRSGSVLGGLAG